MVRFLLFFAFAMCGGYFSKLHAQDSLSTAKFDFDMGIGLGLRYGSFNASKSPSDSALTRIEEITVHGSPGFSAGLSFLISNESKNSFRAEFNTVYLPTSLTVKRIGKPDKKRYLHSLVGEFPIYYQRRFRDFNGSESRGSTNAFIGIVTQVSIPDLDIPPFPAQLFNVQAAIGASRLRKRNSTALINLELRAGLINLTERGSDLESQWFKKIFRNEVVLTMHFL